MRGAPLDRVPLLVSNAKLVSFLQSDSAVSPDSSESRMEIVHYIARQIHLSL